MKDSVTKGLSWENGYKPEKAVAYETEVWEETLHQRAQ